MSIINLTILIMGLSTGETDIYGGAGGLGGIGGGLGGFGLVGLIGLNSFLGRGGLGDGDLRGGAGNVVLEQNVSNIREEIGTLGNEIQVAFSASNINNANNFRALDNQICGINQNLSNLSFAQTLQGVQNTQSIKDQATTNQIIAAENACSIKELIHTDGDLTRSLITQNLIDGLRNELLAERRGRDNREVEINIANTATATQNQMQAQFQQQNQALANTLNMLGDQINRQTNSIVNLGSGVVASPQSNTAANNKVNS